MTKEIISDSTFYICFLDDINHPEGLRKIINSRKFKFVIGPVVEKEIENSPNYRFIEDDLSKVREKPLSFNYGEVVRPFLGINEIEKGEHEVIGIAIVYHLKGRDFILILDEDGPRRIIEKKLSGIKSKMTGTVGFIARCYCEYHIYTKDEAVNILERINNSKFRVHSLIVDKALNEIGGCNQ
ncbi:hypothetical protein [Thermococcus sp.]|uniref:hypothetical protein n=1 Tax=Thermococcus sp. TaxID=35749 RepID=UPI002608780E|nr:hypothetical protein [Thermococcus sp.]